MGVWGVGTRIEPSTYLPLWIISLAFFIRKGKKDVSLTINRKISKYEEDAKVLLIESFI